MSNNWQNIKKLISYSKGGILSKELVKLKSHNLTLFCLAKGSAISEHTASKEGFIYVIEGKGLFWLAGEKIVMLPGVIIYLKRGVKHSLLAEKNTAFLLSLH